MVFGPLADEIQPAIKILSVVKSAAHTDEDLADLGLDSSSGVGPMKLLSTGTSRQPSATMP